jgi:hypothetical protein
MKAITIKQPYASLIIESRKDDPTKGIKDIENRTWPTKFRGRVLIHAGSHIPFRDINQLVINRGIPCWQNEAYPEGAIIGSVEIVDCVIDHPSIWAEKSGGKSIAYPHEMYNWVLANPIKFEHPIPAKGKSSFWEYNI